MSLGRLLTYLLTYLLTHSLTHSLTHTLTHSLTHPLTHSLTHSRRQYVCKELSIFLEFEHHLGDLAFAYTGITTPNKPKVMSAATTPLSPSSPIRLLTYLLTHSLTHSLTHLLTLFLTNSPSYLLTHLFIHSLTHSLTHALTHSLTHLLTHPLTHSPTHSFTYLLNHSLTNYPLKFTRRNNNNDNNSNGNGVKASVTSNPANVSTKEPDTPITTILNDDEAVPDADEVGNSADNNVHDAILKKILTLVPSSVVVVFIFYG